MGSTSTVSTSTDGGRFVKNCDHCGEPLQTPKFVYWPEVVHCSDACNIAAGVVNRLTRDGNR